MFLAEDGRRRSIRTRGWAEIERIENEKLNCRTSILHLPPELLLKIFSYLNFENVSEIRTVCRSFNASCQTTLNFGIKSKIKKIENCLRKNQLELPLRPSLREDHPLHKIRVSLKKFLSHLDALDQAYKRNDYFFIAGEVLDESERILKISAKESCEDIGDEMEDFFELVVLAKRHFLVEVTPKTAITDWGKISHISLASTIQNQNERMFRLEKKTIDQKVNNMEKILERQRKVFLSQKKTIETLRKNYQTQQRNLKKLEMEVQNKNKLLTNQSKLIDTHQTNVLNLTKLVHSNEKAQEKKIAALDKVISSLETKLLKTTTGSKKQEELKKNETQPKPQKRGRKSIN